MATSGISATIPGLLDYESPLMLDIPDAAAVILDILSREARYVKSYATVCNLNSGLGCASSVVIKCKCCSKVLSSLSLTLFVPLGRRKRAQGVHAILSKRVHKVSTQ